MFVFGLKDVVVAVVGFVEVEIVDPDRLLARGGTLDDDGGEGDGSFPRPGTGFECDPPNHTQYRHHQTLLLLLFLTLLILILFLFILGPVVLGSGRSRN